MTAPVVWCRSRLTTGWTTVRPWLASIVATALSTYALDMVATAAGVALVASGIAGGLELKCWG